MNCRVQVVWLSDFRSFGFSLLLVCRNKLYLVSCDGFIWVAGLCSIKRSETVAPAWPELVGRSTTRTQWIWLWRPVAGLRWPGATLRHPPTWAGLVWPRWSGQDVQGHTGKRVAS